MSFWRNITSTFWSPAVWLPPNITWDDIAPGSNADVNYADYRDLVWPLPLALFIIILRYSLERFWIAPVGTSLGIKNTRPKKAANVPLLEIAYLKNSRLDHKMLVGLTKQVEMTERQIERWWRLRRSQDKPSTLVKFSENSWRGIYYTYSFMYGIIVLWDKPWFWDIKQCWYGYPHQSVENGIWWYYMISMAFYWSLAVSQFLDVKRKDFWQMFIHHIVTLLLMALSWVCNLHRVGSLVLVVHDCADIFLEATKVMKYANYQKMCDVLLVVFTVAWIITRLVCFPRIIYSSSVEAPRILPMFPAYFIFNSLLILLLVLHVIWTYFILIVACNAFKAGKMEGDVRSSTSEVSESSENSKLAAENGVPKRMKSTRPAEKQPPEEKLTGI